MHVSFKFVANDLSAEEKTLLTPKRQSELASGFDLVSAHPEAITLKPQERVLVSTGIALMLAKGYEAQVRSRSGLALKNGIVVFNAPGTIDADYRGEIKVILANFSGEDFLINFGMRIAQLVIAAVCLPQLTEALLLDESPRNDAGFGSTGLN